MRTRPVVDPPGQPGAGDSVVSVRVRGLRRATATPTIVEDRSLEVVYSEFFAGWRLALQPGGEPAPALQLFVQPDDHFGVNDVAGSNPVVAEGFEARLREWAKTRG